MARALVSNPSLLLLDEPTRGVDIKTRDEVMHLLHELNHQGITIAMTTHEINTVAAHLPWLVCIKGHILAEGPPSEVISPEILQLTYGAEMPVIEYEGMTLVAESPHHFARKGRSMASANGRVRQVEAKGKHSHSHEEEAEIHAHSVGAPGAAGAD